MLSFSCLIHQVAEPFNNQYFPIKSNHLNQNLMNKLKSSCSLESTVKQVYLKFLVKQNMQHMNCQLKKYVNTNSKIIICKLLPQKRLSLFKDDYTKRHQHLFKIIIYKLLPQENINSYLKIIIHNLLSEKRNNYQNCSFLIFFTQKFLQQNHQRKLPGHQ